MAGVAVAGVAVAGVRGVARGEAVGAPGTGVGDGAVVTGAAADVGVGVAADVGVAGAVGLPVGVGAQAVPPFQEAIIRPENGSSG